MRTRSWTTGEPGEICVIAARPCSRATTTTRRPMRRPSAAAGSTPAISAVWTREGFVYITGRASDMYISGGSNIYPREIEEKLLHPSCGREVAVLGVPDPVWGEVGVAVCVARRGPERSDAEAEIARRSLSAEDRALQDAEALLLLGGPAEIGLRQNPEAHGARRARGARIARSR